MAKTDIEGRADVVEPPLGGGEPEPPLKEEPATPAELWLRDATEARSVLGRGEAYSPGAIAALMVAAIPLVEGLVAVQGRPPAPEVEPPAQRKR
jgi:hypothetical protein